MKSPLFGSLVCSVGPAPAPEPGNPPVRAGGKPRAGSRSVVLAALAALALACLTPQSARADEAQRAAAVPATERLGDALEPRWREPRCRVGIGAESFARTELFFGLSRPGGVVTEADFKNFIDASVTPRFPDGLTLLSGVGKFRDASGTAIVEGAKLLVLLYPRRDGDSNRRIEQIRADYKHQFQQESVLRTDEQSCVSF